MLASITEDFDLEICHIGAGTHYHIQTDTASMRGVSLSSSDALLDFQWVVILDLYGSEHYLPMLFSPESNLSTHVPRRCLHRAHLQEQTMVG